MDYSLLTSLTVSIASFSAGTAISWSSPVIEKLINADTDSPFDEIITEADGSWISAIFLLGSATAPFIFGNLVDRIGRKYTILGAGVPLLIGYLMLAFSKTIILYYIARFICGIGAGGVFNIIPVYIGEIANKHNRGALSSIFNLLLCSGNLFSYCVGPYVSITTFNVALAAFPAVFLVSFFIVGPESAYYYIKKGKYDLAIQVQKKIRGRYSGVEEELELISKTIRESGDGTFLDIFRSKALAKAFVISIGIMIFQQFSGIIVVLSYAQNIFVQAGVNLDSALCSIIIGVVQLGVAFVTPLVIDRLGRKKLLLFSGIGMFISEAPLGVYSLLKEKNYDVSAISLLPLICLIVYTITYNFGFGPLAWTVMGELFPTNVKSSATTFATFFCWFMAFHISKYFQTIATAHGMGIPFLVFAGCCGFSILFSFFVVIETKGKSLQEIQEELAK